MNFTDVAERSVVTFAEAFLAALVVTDLSSAKGAVMAGVAAVVSLAKSIVASLKGDGTPSLFT
ncbi:MAG: Holin [Myxococcota bacterium]|jgi:uncharacterized membrane protein YgaE (UPF0421/DUF939 family)|nr:Holin [Myxococcota bacterium]